MESILNMVMKKKSTLSEQVSQQSFHEKSIQTARPEKIMFTNKIE